MLRGSSGCSRPSTRPSGIIFFKPINFAGSMFTRSYSPTKMLSGCMLYIQYFSSSLNGYGCCKSLRVKGAVWYIRAQLRIIMQLCRCRMAAWYKWTCGCCWCWAWGKGPTTLQSLPMQLSSFKRRYTGCRSDPLNVELCTYNLLNTSLFCFPHFQHSQRR